MFFYPDYSFVHQEARYPATAKMHFSSQFAHTWLVREPLVLAVSQLVQIGTAGKVDHGGWAAHQDLSKHSHFFILGSREFGIDVLKCNRQVCHQIVFRGGKERLLNHLCIDEAGTVLPPLSRSVELILIVG